MCDLLYFKRYSTENVWKEFKILLQRPESIHMVFHSAQFFFVKEAGIEVLQPFANRYDSTNSVGRCF